MSEYVQGVSRHGDLIVDLFCQGPTFIREAALAGRRALGLSVNPLLLAAAQLGLSGRNDEVLNAAFTALADSPKGSVPLARYLTSLYASSCPVCGAAGVAEWFAWDRDGKYTFEKAVNCPDCESVQVGLPDDADIDASRRIARRGLAYYYALDRVAPPGHPARERAASLVELYTPRNLSALIDLSMRLEGLDVGRESCLVLAGALLDSFDAGSSLDPYGEDRPRPLALRVPALYVERNVWLCFERAFSRLLEGPVQPPSIVRVADAETLARGKGGEYALASHASRDVRRVIAPGSVPLIVTDPPRPDGVFWALSALWAGWLWDTPSSRRLRPFLRRRRFDWDWYWRVLLASLKAAAPLLTAQGRLLAIFAESDTDLLESFCLAAAGAGYALDGWGYSSDAGYRLVWRLSDGHASPAQNSLESSLEEEASRAVAAALAERGEPAGRGLVHAGAVAALAESGLLAQAALAPKEGPSPLSLVAGAVRRAIDDSLSSAHPDEREGERLWWPADAAKALSDRVEALVQELLLGRPSWTAEQLVNRVYGRLHGACTPDLGLVLVCVDAYSVQQGTAISLRPGDDPERRAKELESLRRDLVEMGKRMGFTCRQGGEWDVRWLEGGEDVYVFDVTAAADLAGRLLPRRDVGERAWRCLVLPGGRASLVTFKLQRDPRLPHAVERDRWRFVKFRHLRTLLSRDDLDRHALKTVLGLDPIVEQAAAQIPLF